MRWLRTLHAVSLALVCALVTGTSAGLAAPTRQDSGPATPSADGATTLPRCSDLGNPAASAGDIMTGSEPGVQEAPSAGLSAEQQAVAAQGASTAGLDDPGVTVDPRGGTVPVDCADTASSE